MGKRFLFGHHEKKKSFIKTGGKEGANQREVHAQYAA
jgi:hypothetical protein